MDEPAAAGPAGEVPGEFTIVALPTARQLVGRGLDLVVGATPQLRIGSLFVAGTFLGLAGPFAIVAVELVSKLPGLLSPGDLRAPNSPFVRNSAFGPDSPFGLAFVGIAVLSVIASIGFVVLSIEGSIIAESLLAGRLTGRPLSLRQAVIRSRQTFWRVVRGSLIVGLPLAGLSMAISAALGSRAGQGSDAPSLVASLAVGFVGAPFTYLISGIVLGDVGAREALRRSIRLTRARWRLPLIMALLAFVSGAIELFALGAGLDEVTRVAGVLHLGFDADVPRRLVSYLLLLVGVLALGTLAFTIGAILAAPRVVAFVGLTQFSGGLDRAREADAAMSAPAISAPILTGPADQAPPPSHWSNPPPPAAFRWLSVPTILGIVTAVVVAVATSYSLRGL